MHTLALQLTKVRHKDSRVFRVFGCGGFFSGPVFPFLGCLAAAAIAPCPAPLEENGVATG
jgi:hypothetical protein